MKHYSVSISATKPAKFPSEKLFNYFMPIFSSSGLRYCNTICGNCGATLKDKLKKLKNTAAGVVINAH